MFLWNNSKFSITFVIYIISVVLKFFNFFINFCRLSS
nr:MAG TPA: hypothetical protein [Bacteriophage sp.]